MVLYIAVLIIFVVALVIINNAMVMATLQRVKEIGTMRAIGAQRRFVLAMLLVETRHGRAALRRGRRGAGRAAVLGSSRPPAASRPATTSSTSSSPARRSCRGSAPPAVAGSLAIVLVVSLVSGLYPALIAMRVTPVEAMAAED